MQVDGGPLRRARHAADVDDGSARTHGIEQKRREQARAGRARLIAGARDRDVHASGRRIDPRVKDVGKPPCRMNGRPGPLRTRSTFGLNPP